MDWGKAKNILIIVFLALNIFLLGNISLNTLSKDNSKEAIANTEAILKSRNIRMETEIPSFNGEMGRIEIYNEPYFSMQRAAVKLMGSKVELPVELKSGLKISDRGKEFIVESDAAFIYKNSNLQEKWDISQKKSLEKQVRKFIRDVEIKDAEFILDSYDVLGDGSVRLSFIHKYQGLYIFSNRINVIATEAGVKELDCRVMKLGGVSKGANKVIPAYKVLLTSFGNSPNTVITGIDIGYNIDILDKDAKGFYAKPVWRVKTKGNEPQSFDAVTG